MAGDGTDTAARRGRNNRRRGQQGERDFCALCRDEFGTATKRNLGQERDCGTDVPVGPFRVEVKRRKRVAGLYGWLNQAESGCGAGNIPAVAVRQDHEEFLVVMRFSDWARLARGEM